MGRRLRIAITVDPEIPVPPDHYGGIERIVYMLACGLRDRGHEVYLFANPESRAPVTLIPYRGRKSSSFKDTIYNAAQISAYLRKIEGADIVHSFSRLAYLLPLMGSTVPKIQSYQRHISPRSIKMGTMLAGESITFTACSESCARIVDYVGGRWAVIPNGVPIEKYTYVSKVSSDAPFIFLGRVERIKGAHTAIEVARRTGRRLLIAGNHAMAGAERDYFFNEVLPYCDGDRIQYIGPVNDAQKNDFLGKAAAMLFPIEWEEPFGIVMAESLACGTPVIAFKRGAVPEVIQHRQTGFVCQSLDEMVEAAQGIRAVDRLQCRRAAEQRFSDVVIVRQYEQLYYSCLETMEQ